MLKETVRHGILNILISIMISLPLLSQTWIKANQAIIVETLQTTSCLIVILQQLIKTEDSATFRYVMVSILLFHYVRQFNESVKPSLISHINFMFFMF